MDTVVCPMCGGYGYYEFYSEGFGVDGRDCSYCLGLGHAPVGGYAAHKLSDKKRKAADRKFQKFLDKVFPVVK